MKKTITKLAIAAMLVLPALASAASYSGNIAFDEYDFSLTSTSDVAIRATWSDMLLTDATMATRDSNGFLGWSLTSTTAATQVGSINNTPAATGTRRLSFDNLVSGDYKLVFTGFWSNMTAPGGYDNIVAGKVNLVDASFRSTPVTPVPEPETYAMMLAGLMMMGTIARRRSSTRK